MLASSHLLVGGVIYDGCKGVGQWSLVKEGGEGYTQDELVS